VKKIVTLGILVALFFLTATACASETRGADILLKTDENLNSEWDTLYRFEKDGLWGFRDIYGDVVIEPQYGFASEFSEGLAIIRGIPDNKDLWGFIDLTGALVISLPSIIGVTQGFSEGFAVIIEREWDWDKEEPLVVSSVGPFVFIDRLGQNIFGQEFETVRPFKNGLARVALYRGGFIFIDRTGQNAFNMEFDFAGDFDEHGYARVTLLNGRERYINRSGRIVRNR
jgi:hypothetical protein